MKPSRFRYYSPANVAEAVSLLQELGDDTAVLAGGQSLMPLLNMRLAKPKAVIDLNKVEGLNDIRISEGNLEIGAMVRQRTVEKSPLVGEHFPLLAHVTSHIGSVQIRNRGTIGGSIAHADPAAQLPAMLLLVDGWVEVNGPQGERTIPASELFLTYFTTTVAPGEIITRVVLPLPPAGAGWCYQQIARRDGDFALAAVACWVDLDEDGSCREARLALSGVADAPVRAYEAEKLLRGRILDDGLAAAVAEAVQADIEPESDIHATAEYRRHVAGVLARRAVSAAWDRAVGGKAVRRDV